MRFVIYSYIPETYDLVDTVLQGFEAYFVSIFHDISATMGRCSVFDKGFQFPSRAVQQPLVHTPEPTTTTILPLPLSRISQHVPQFRRNQPQTMKLYISSRTSLHFVASMFRSVLRQLPHLISFALSLLSTITPIHKVLSQHLRSH